MVELYNESSATIDISGLSLSDDHSDPRKFVFPSGSTIPAHGFAVLWGGSRPGPGFQLGFTLGEMGGKLHLFDRLSRGGGMIDSVKYGVQISNFSIGVLPDGSWGLTQPTPG